MENYWSAINNHEFARAYSYYSQHERDTQAGGESAWIAGHEREGIQSATGTFSVGDVSADSATINVDSLQTVDNANGCQNWAGSYSMVREGDRRCGGTDRRGGGRRHPERWGRSSSRRG